MDDARRLYSLLSANSRTVLAKVVYEWSVARAAWDVPGAGDHVLGFVIQIPNEEEVEPAQEFLDACQISATVAFRKR